MWAATGGDTGQVWESADAGLNWELQFRKPSRNLLSIAAAYGLITAADDSGCTYTSSDGGDTWVQSNDVPGLAKMYSMEVSESVLPGKLLAGTGDTYGDAFVGEFESDVGGAVLSGANWGYDAVSWEENMWVGTGPDTGQIWRSTDYGVTWKMASGTPWDNTLSLAYAWNELCAGTDDSGMVYVSYDFGDIWLPANAAPGASHVYSLEWSKTVFPRKLLAATGDVYGDVFVSDRTFVIDVLEEKTSSDSTLLETAMAKTATINDIEVNGDLSGAIDFSDYETVVIHTGPFAGKGFSKGEWEGTLDGTSYSGTWEGLAFHDLDERKIHLKGIITGDLSATVDGHLIESVPGSEVYDQYQAIWKIGKMKGAIVSATINLNGDIAYQDESEYPSIELFVLQGQFEGSISGDYAGQMELVLTQVRIVNDTTYDGEGFSILSYHSRFGSGQGWTYNVSSSSIEVHLRGMTGDPLYGVVHGTLDESDSPRYLYLTIDRVDLGLPPAAAL